MKSQVVTEFCGKRAAEDAPGAGTTRA